jgi:pimeloyl-ACP methyl ester carboxylesterase
VTRLAKKHRVVRLQALNIHAAEQGVSLPDDYSVQHEVRAAGAALDKIGIAEPVDLLGWSYGAVVGLTFAMSYPQRVRSLILVEPPAFSLLEGEPRDEGFERMRALLAGLGPHANVTEDQVESFRCALGNCPPGQHARDNPKWPLWLQQRFRMRGLSVLVSHRVDEKRLEELYIPVLIITGKSTVTFHRRINEILAKHLPMSISVEIDGGHAAPVQSRDSFLDELEAFLDAH